MRFIEYSNVLYVNCKGLRNGDFHLGKGYAFAYCLKNGGIIFVSMPVGSNEFAIGIASGFSFGLIGAGIADTMISNKLVCYLLSSDSEKVKRLNIDDIEEMLLEYDDIMKQYKDEDNKKSAQTIIRYLKKAGLIKNCFSESLD